MAFKSRLKCLFLKPIFCILFATFLHFARNTTPAKILHLENRVGSIKPGKDADFIICTKSLIDLNNTIKNVYINGIKAV